MSDPRDRFHDDDSQDQPADPTAASQAEIQTPHDALAAYALGVLDVGEQRLFELHLFVCMACRSELAAYQRTASLLPYTLAPEQPPTGARERLLSRARGEASESLTVSMPIVAADEAPTVIGAAPPTSEAPTAVQPAAAHEEATSVGEAVVVPVEREGAQATAPVTHAQPRRGVRIKLASVGWAAALLLVIAAGLVGFVWSATGPHVSPEVQILARLPGGQLLSLRGSAVPSASARLFVAENGRRAELDVDALPPLAPGRVYQLWFDEPGQPSRTGGAFGVDQRGDAVVRVVVPTPLERVRAVGITQEPAPGLASPTGVRLLDWTP